MAQQAPHPLIMLFGPRYSPRWLADLGAAAIADPEAAERLGPYLGPEDEPIKGGTRPRTPGDKHFNNTWRIIKPGFLRTGGSGYAKHTNRAHKIANVPGDLLSMPIQWAQVMLANTVTDLKYPQLIPIIWEAGELFATDIGADLKIVRMPYDEAKKNMQKYFSGVKIAPEQAWAFWGALKMDPVKSDLGGRIPSDIKNKLERHLPSGLVAQYMHNRPRR